MIRTNMSESPSVSIVLTTYYRNEPLVRALEKCTTQTYTDVETIVVDDSGCSYAEPIVSDYEDAQYVPHEENKGQIAAWHTGYEVASGDYIQFHDDDDWIDTSKIEKQVKRLEHIPNAGVAFCSLYDLRAGSVNPVEPEYGRETDMLKLSLANEGYPCVTTSMLIESTVLEDVFPLKLYPAGTDMPLQIELASRTNFEFVDEFLMYRGYSMDAQGRSVEAGRNHLQIIEDYSELYERYDDELKRSVIASRYEMMGRASLDDHIWSRDAIRYLFLANYYRRTLDPKTLQLFLGSMLGQPGITLGGWLKSAIRSVT